MDREVCGPFLKEIMAEIFNEEFIERRLRQFNTWHRRTNGTEATDLLKEIREQLENLPAGKYVMVGGLTVQDDGDLIVRDFEVIAQEPK